MLLTSLIKSQFVQTNADSHELIKNAHFSFFRAKIEHAYKLEKLFYDTVNSFDLLSYLTSQSNVDTLHYGQAIKAEDSDQFKSLMNQEI